MKISELLTLEYIEIRDNVKDKYTLIEQLIEIAGRGGNIKDSKAAYDDVISREKIMSTGVGKGIALPHAKTDHIKKAAASLVLVQEPVDYEALDYEPVKLSILLLSKSDNVSLHLKLLSQISRLLNNDSLRNRIMESNSKNEIFEQILKFENFTENSEKKRISL